MVFIMVFNLIFLIFVVINVHFLLSYSFFFNVMFSIIIFAIFIKNTINFLVLYNSSSYISLLISFI